MSRFVVSPEARRDLDLIADHLLDSAGPRVARKVLKDLHHAMRFLAKHPEAGHRREDLTQKPVKFWLVYSYFIIYLPASRPIQVVRVLHARRELPPRLRS